MVCVNNSQAWDKLGKKKEGNDFFFLVVEIDEMCFKRQQKQSKGLLLGVIEWV